MTEFLPISSSGHLELTKAVFQTDLGTSEILFDLILHLGTLFAVCAVYRKKIFALFHKPYKKLIMLAVATIPAATVGFFLDEIIEEKFMNGLSVGICFILTAFLLFLCGRRAKKGFLRSMKSSDCITMGFAQAAAILPGLSRSGATISAGVLCGADADEVADFSFLMSIPIISGSLILKLFKLFFDGNALASTLESFGGGLNLFFCFVFGMLSSASVGYFAIKCALRSVKKAKYNSFCMYLLAVAAISFFMYARGIFV